MKRLIIALILINMQLITYAQNEDKYQWLEEVENEKALQWAEDWNEKTLKVLKSQPVYDEIYNKNLEIFNSTDRIANPSLKNNYVYNFWQDANHQRGIWRRTSKENYLKGSPNWEVLLDIDQLSKKDSIKWVYKGAIGMPPSYDRFLVQLSRGGGDAVVVKEFDVNSKTFVEGGFTIPESKLGVSWIDENTLMLATNFNTGMTTSGYPKEVRILRRGDKMEDAQPLFAGKENDMGIWPAVIWTPERTYQLINQRASFYSGTNYFVEDGGIFTVDVPDDITFTAIFKNQVIFQLKSDWNVNNQTFKQGALISIDYNDLLKGHKNYKEIVTPDDRSSISGVSNTKNYLLVNILNNVKGELYAYSFNNNDWTVKKINTPELGTISIGSSDDHSDEFFYYFQNFLTPASIYYTNAATGDQKVIQSLPSFYDTDKYKAEQFDAISKDGTRIPYFVLSSKNIKYDGSNPTLLYAYGGFEIPMLPSFSALTGTAWLEKGGVYVLANIRGGGEFGPKWHQAGLKENRQRVYDDFHSVAESLMKKKITSPQKLGIYGGSNGGLLMGVAFTQRPDLYEAVISAVPLLDMKRYNKLLAGASWMGEYGNPDIPEEWEYIKKYSPYQNVKKDADYPEVFFTTSTRDDRVHPGHARKMVAKMSDMGHKVYYYENTEGGHAGASTNEQRAQLYALIYSYLHMKLMK